MRKDAWGKGRQNCKVCEDGVLGLEEVHWLWWTGWCLNSSKVRVIPSCGCRKRFWRLEFSERGKVGIGFIYVYAVVIGSRVGANAMVLEVDGYGGLRNSGFGVY